MLSISILLFSSIILLRLIFRKLIDLPNYSGKIIADNSEFENLMLESKFWNIIQIARNNSKGKYSLQCALLTEELEKLNSPEIIQFNRTFITLMAKTYNFKLWEAAYALNGGCSDDAFEYFRSWLIGQGRNKFYWTIKYPRLLLLIGVKELLENYEGIAYCAYEAYENKTRNTIPKVNDIKYQDAGPIFNEGGAIFRYLELALLAW